MEDLTDKAYCRKWTP